MRFPSALQKSIDRLILSGSFSHLKSARQNLTDRYQTGFTPDVSSKGSGPFIQTQEERLTYLATRMPGTYAVCRKVLGLLQDNASSLASLLDLGAGPGTVFWAAYPLFPHLNKVTLVEQDQDFIALGRYFLEYSSLDSSFISWKQESFLRSADFPAHDLVTLSYVIGELPPSAQLTLCQAAWDATANFLVIIEPGTPQGFERIRRLRHFLLSQGGYMVAPCPHSHLCPMSGGNWCHFSQRLERTSTHRLIKDVSLGFEDEKYSYLVVSKSPRLLPESRIISRPLRKKGHYLLDLCTSNGLKRSIISKRMEVLYKQIRQLEWGDPGPAIETQNHDQ